MTDAFSQQTKNRTYLLLGSCLLLAVAAAVVGIDDNPPGILSAFLAAAALVLAFVHPWRKARQFLYLLLAAVLGAVLFAVLNNLVALVAHDPATPFVLQLLLQALAVAAFLIATLICPAAFLVGAVGAIVMVIRSRRRT